MGFLARLKTGWRLAMDSVGVIRSEPSLLLFPLIAGAAGLVYLGSVSGALLFGGLETGLADNEIAQYAGLFVLYLGSTFIASFFTAGLMHNAREVFRGNDPTVGEGLRAAWANKGPLLAWAAISATVGLVFRAAESSDNPAAEVVTWLFSVAWSIVTYFIVPVIVFEDVGVAEMFKRSGETFRQTWGEELGASFGVGTVTVVFLLVGVVLAGAVTFLLFQAGVVAGLVAGVVTFLAVGLLTYLFASALSSIARTALYVYATSGERPAGYEDVDFEHPVA